MTTRPLPAADLDQVLAATRSLWDEVRGRRIFISGGTGFFGCWMVETFLHINRALALDARATVLTRDPEAFLRKVPHLRHDPALTLLEGDVRDFAFPAEPHDFVIHAATEASARQLAENPQEMLSTILEGTQRVLSFAVLAKTRKLLLTSSGAVYGPQPPRVTHLLEDYAGAHPALPHGNVYAEGKRASELMCARAARTGLEVKITRGYAFVGPHLPLDAHFAAGNFLADALAGRNIKIASDGSSVRSYLYAADLAIWLWTILFRAPSLRAYNVGSEDEVTIRQLAETIQAVVNPAIAVEVAQTPDPNRIPDRYVPSTSRARSDLGLRQTVPLDEALRRTAAWHRLE